MEFLQKALLGIIIAETILAVPIFGYAAYQYAEAKRTEQAYEEAMKRANEVLKKHL